MLPCHHAVTTVDYDDAYTPLCVNVTKRSNDGSWAAQPRSSLDAISDAGQILYRAITGKCPAGETREAREQWHVQVSCTPSGRQHQHGGRPDQHHGGADSNRATHARLMLLPLSTMLLMAFVDVTRVCCSTSSCKLCDNWAPTI
jgi:hypothetical protein